MIRLSNLAKIIIRENMLTKLKTSHLVITFTFHWVEISKNVGSENKFD